MTRVRWKLTIEYDGRPFKGWQRQELGIPSVQETIETAIYAFCQQQATVHVAGRTDAGVHARGQVAHVDLDIPDRYTGFHVLKAINAHMREVPVVVVDAVPVPDDFHARFSATNKLYQYRIVNRPSESVMDRGFVWDVHPPLDVDAMRAGAAHLIGHHDFTTFRDSDCQAKSPLKTLGRLDIETHLYDQSGGVEIRIYAEGRSFLHHQVRNMVGTLAQVGRGVWVPDDIRVALEARDRTRGGPTAPPDGLSLMRVDYDPRFTANAK